MAKRIPFTKLRRAVRDAARAAFATVRLEHPSETFYAFALWTNDLAQSVTAVANSVEGLDRTVARYWSNSHESCDADGMRWSYGDWDYQSVGEAHFRGVNEMLLAVTADRCTDGEDAASEQRLAKLFAAIVGGLKDLDDEGFFGSGAERERVAIMIVGDIDDAFADRCILKLNPAAVAATLVKPESLPPECRELGPAASEPTSDIALSPDGTLLLVATDNSVLGFDLPGFTARKPLRLNRGRTGEYEEFEAFTINKVVFSPDGNEFATSHLHNSYGVVARWAAGKRRPIAVTNRLEWGCNEFAWSPAGTIFAGACRDKVIRLWSVDRFEPLRELAAHGRHSRCLAFHPDGRTLVSLDEGEGGCLRSWNPATGAIEWHVEDGGWGFSFVPNSDRIAVIPLREAEPREVRFRSRQDGALVGRIAVGVHAAAVAFSSDGRLMAIGGSYSNPTAELWDLEREVRIAEIAVEWFNVLALRFINSDRAVAIIARDRYGHPPLLVWSLDRVV